MTAAFESQNARRCHFALCSPPVITERRAVERQRSGILAAVGAFAIWGVLPVYWKLLGFLPPATIVAQRTVWSLVVLLILLAWHRQWPELQRHLRRPQALGWHAVSGALLACNWLLYVWATLHGRILEAALGYYLNPFFNMLFGVWWFGERHNRRQLAAIALALCGVAIQLPAAGRFPWVALTLALTFALYGVIKKRAAHGARFGLTVETVLLAPLALGWLFTTSASPAAAFGGSWDRAVWVAATGLATTLPLIFFGHAARNIRLTTLGILQFMAPTLQFLIGWQLFGEPLSRPQTCTFALIWLAVALYAGDALVRRRG